MYQAPHGHHYHLGKRYVWPVMQLVFVIASRTRSLHFIHSTLSEANGCFQLIEVIHRYMQSGPVRRDELLDAGRAALWRVVLQDRAPRVGDGVATAQGWFGAAAQGRLGAGARAIVLTMDSAISIGGTGVHARTSRLSIIARHGVVGGHGRAGRAHPGWVR
jgi:hypothetical protein